ncbi:hypothetical protein [Lysinibacillus pakistanensis]|uniref:hypothetical protein n=1 Tax=Lysinibacillus pakistanensis TaxID=759811 RepID=UPI003D294B5F
MNDNNKIINFPTLKLATNNFEVDFDLEMLPLASVETDQRNQSINQALNAIQLIRKQPLFEIELIKIKNIKETEESLMFFISFYYFLLPT